MLIQETVVYLETIEGLKDLILELCSRLCVVVAIVELDNLAMRDTYLLRHVSMPNFLEVTTNCEIIVVDRGKYVAGENLL